MRSAVSHSSCWTSAIDFASSLSRSRCSASRSAEEGDGIVAVEPRPLAQVAEGIGDRQSRPGVGRQLLALVDDRARDRVLEFAFRQLHLDRLALAGLAQRVGRDEPDLDRQAGPGMRRQVVIAGGLRLLEVQAGQRHFELDRLVGIAAFAPDHRLDRFDPVIVARLIIDAQRRMRRAFGRFCEGDLGRVVGNDLDLPVAERRARLRHRELACRSSRSPRPGNSACRPRRNRGSPHRSRGAGPTAAMHLREQLAAGRDADRLACLRPQELRRQPGIFGRRHPDVEAGGDRRRPPAISGAKARTRRSRQSAPGVDRADQQQDRQDGAQPPRIARAKPAARQPDPQPPRRCLHAPPVGLPQRRRCASSGPLGRSASACSGRCSRPLACSMRRRAADHRE